MWKDLDCRRKLPSVLIFLLLKNVPDMWSGSAKDLGVCSQSSLSLFQDDSLDQKSDNCDAAMAGVF